MSNAYKIVNKFEETIAEYCGSKYAVAVDSCTNAIFLCCVYLRQYFGGAPMQLSIPKRTYPGVACAIVNSGNMLKFRDKKWDGIYGIVPANICDGALRFKENMFVGNATCISFHSKKHIPIGRGGMILCKDKWMYHWLKKARFDGRNECALSEDKIDMVGWNMYITPEQAARGLVLFDLVKDKDLPDLKVEEQGYPDLSKIEAYK